MYLLIIPLFLLEWKRKAKTTKIEGFLQFRERAKLTVQGLNPLSSKYRWRRPTTRLRVKTTKSVWKKSVKRKQWKYRDLTWQDCYVQELLRAAAALRNQKSWENRGEKEAQEQRWAQAWEETGRSAVTHNNMDNFNSKLLFRASLRLAWHCVRMAKSPVAALLGRKPRVYKYIPSPI